MQNEMANVIAWRWRTHESKGEWRDGRPTEAEKASRSYKDWIEYAYAASPSAGVVVSDSVVMAACIAAYSACDMGPFPSMAVDPASDLRFVRAALEAALAAAPRGEGKVA